jgi:hypothetical protein
MTWVGERMIPMSPVLEKPTVEAVMSAGEKFDEENRYLERALTELFTQWPNNTDHAHVYLKVVTLNVLYSTQIPLYSERIPTIWNVVDRIVGLDIDSALTQGSADLVDKIAAMVVTGKDRRYNYSFATKYCSWQRPDAYPIFDSRVNEYLWRLRNQGGLIPFKRDELWDYTKFKKIVTEFRDKYDLGKFTFKETDKFLYLEGGKLLTEIRGETRSGGDDQSTSDPREERG